MPLRKPHHAGSWYSDNGKVIDPVCIYNITLSTGEQLNGELEGWLGKATSSHSPARAIIAPYPLY